MQNKTIGIIIADNYEYLPFLKAVEKYSPQSFSIHSYEAAAFQFNGNRVVALKCRTGKVNAATAAAFLIEKENPLCILNIGLSGGVYAVQRGDVIAGTSFTECDFDLTAIGYKQGEKPEQPFVYAADSKLMSLIPENTGIKFGKFGTGDFFITKEQMKADFLEKFGIKAFDMETAAIASVCHFGNIPFLSIRKISDDSEESAADDYHKMNKLCETALADILVDVMKQL